MELEVLTKMVESYALLLIPLVTGIVQVVKRFLPEGAIHKWTPVVSITVAIGISFLVIPGTAKQIILIGLIVGLSASGFYSAIKGPFKKIEI